jgi:hypothetical protein
MNTAISIANIAFCRRGSLPIAAGEASELSSTVQKHNSSSSNLQFHTYIARLSP